MAERDWQQIGAVPEGSSLASLAVSSEGFGFAGVTREPKAGTLLERMSARGSVLLRVTAPGAEPVYEGKGWIQAVDGLGQRWVALEASLRADQQGSEYRLLRSDDAGRSWRVVGPIPASSASQVLLSGEAEVWSMGAHQLWRSADGGASWERVSLEGDRQPHAERLRRIGDAVAVVSRDFVALTANGGRSWIREPHPTHRLHDVSDGFLVSTEDGKARVQRRLGVDLERLWVVPAGREPLQLAAAGDVVRLLTRDADPAQPLRLTVHRSEDGGQSWETTEIGGAHAALAGAEAGLTVDLRGTLRGVLR